MERRARGNKWKAHRKRVGTARCREAEREKEANKEEEEKGRNFFSFLNKWHSPRLLAVRIFLMAFFPRRKKKKKEKLFSTNREIDNGFFFFYIFTWIFDGFS